MDRSMSTDEVEGGVAFDSAERDVLVQGLALLAYSIQDSGAPDYGCVEKHYVVDDLRERLGAPRIYGPRP